jgi:hypothetical protein
MSKFSICVGFGAVAIGGAVIHEWRMNAGLMIADPAHDYLPMFAAAASSSATASVVISMTTMEELRDTITGDVIAAKPEEPLKQTEN